MKMASLTNFHRILSTSGIIGVFCWLRFSATFIIITVSSFYHEEIKRSPLKLFAASWLKVQNLDLKRVGWVKVTAI
jgi:hypothetical protein